MRSLLIPSLAGDEGLKGDLMTLLGDDEGRDAGAALGSGLKGLRNRTFVTGASGTSGTFTTFSFCGCFLNGFLNKVAICNFN
jgi:hypothetical protein